MGGLSDLLKVTANYTGKAQDFLGVSVSQEESLLQPWVSKKLPLGEHLI